MLSISLSLSHTLTTSSLSTHKACRACVYHCNHVSAPAAFRLTGSFWGSAWVAKDLVPTVLYPGYSCYGICIVALPAAINVCMFPAENDPAEGGVISLTSTAQMTLHTQNTHVQKYANTHTLAHWYVVITTSLLLAA